MTVYHPTLEPVFAGSARTGLRLHLGRRAMRGVARVLLIFLLGLVFFLLSVETVVALEQW